MNNLFKLIVGIGILCIGTISFASPLTTTDYPSALSGLYMGIQGGMASLDTRGIPTEIKAASKDTSQDEGFGLSGRAFVGYLWGHNALRYGAEIGGMMYPANKYEVREYVDPDDMEVTNLNWQYESYLLDLLAVGKAYVGSRVNFFVKAGLAFVDQEFKPRAEVVSGDEEEDFEELKDKTENEIIPEVQVGMGFTFSQNWDVNIAYLQTFGSKPKPVTSNSSGIFNRVASVQAVMLGVAYHFV